MPDPITAHDLVDPQLAPVLAMMPEEFSASNLEMLRQPFPPFPMPDELLAATTMEHRTIPGLDGDPDVPVVIFRPTAPGTQMPGIVYYHGGGFVMGQATMGEASNRAIVAALGCVIVSVDYRLAPEHVYPAQVNDGYAALKWFWENAADLGVKPERIGVMGDSAGGGLAAAIALMARDKGEYRLAFQFLVYPMLDDRTCTKSDPHPFAGQFGWNGNSNRFGWSSLLGHEPGGDGVSQYAAPARAEDLAGLPPTFLLTAALDLFVEENLEYARRLMRAGVPVELHSYPGAIHGFYSIPGADVSAQAVNDGMAALARFFAASA